MKKNNLLLMGLALFFVLSPGLATAEEAYTFIIKKQEEKAKSRWSLSEWLDTRDRMRMMDLWLALHSPSPYEFILGGSYHFANTTPGGKYNPWDLQATAYASIFGLSAQRESSSLDTRWRGLFHLRIFGMYAQATNITLQLGIKSTSNDSTLYRNALAGVSMTIYLAKSFGIEGLYRHSFASTPNASDFLYDGDRYEGTAFIDFKFLRIFGNYYYEKENLESPTAVALLERSGIAAGGKFFF